MPKMDTPGGRRVPDMAFDGAGPSIFKSIAQLHRKRAADRNGLRHVRANAIPVAPLFAAGSGSLDTFSVAEQG